MNLWAKRGLWVAIALAGIIFWHQPGQAAVSSVELRLDQLEYQLRSLQTEVRQLRAQRPGEPVGVIPLPPAPAEAPTLPGDLPLEAQFDNLATLVIEINQRLQTLEAQFAPASSPQ